MNKTEKRVLFFKLIAYLIRELQKENIDMMPFSFHRTPEEQRVLFEHGKSNTLESMHLHWLAIDLVLMENGDLVWGRNAKYERAGSLWESLGGTWGGRWKSLNDVYHFEFDEKMAEKN